MSALNITITDSSAQNNGGAFYISGTSSNTLDFDSITITNTKSDKIGGTFYISNLN